MNRSVERSGSTYTSFIEGLKARDAQKWTLLNRLYAPLIRYWCEADHKISESDIEDVAQEVFAAVSRNINRFQWTSQQGSFRGWLRRITSSKAVDLQRRQGKRPVAKGGSTFQNFLQQIGNPEKDKQNYERELLLQRFWQHVIDTLPALRISPATWEAFRLTELEGLSTAEVAQRLGITESGVRMAKRRVREKLSPLKDELKFLWE